MRTTEAKVGAFVLICAAILCTAVYRIGDAQFSGARVAYRTYLRYAGGLELGTTVLFGGIAVGKVTRVAPDASDPTRIEIDLDVKQGTPVTARSVAKLGAVSLMGGAVISITTGAREAPRLAPGVRGSMIWFRFGAPHVYQSGGPVAKNIIRWWVYRLAALYLFMSANNSAATEEFTARSLLYTP